MSNCTHHWTVTSECPFCLRAEIERLKTRPESEAAQSLAIVREFLRRVTHWKPGLPSCQDAMEALDKADDDVDWIERGIVEWRYVALKTQAELATVRAAQATARKLLHDARTAIGYSYGPMHPLFERIDAALEGKK